MTNLVGQLKRWRLVERLVRLAWGVGIWAAVVGAALAAACLTDWLADRYLGSEAWRKFRTATWVFAPRSAPADDQWYPDGIVDETPKWLRVLMTGGQLALAAGLAYRVVVRPWLRTPPVDELAGAAERAIPAFGHRLVTAVQLNRPAARTAGMSPVLIAAVTREAGALVRDHNLLKLVNYSRLIPAAAAALPVLLGWAAFAVAKPELADVLLRRQALQNVEIPRTVHLANVSQEVWPTGAEVTVRYRVTGEYDAEATGRLRVDPDGQPGEFYDLKFEREGDGGGYYAAKLPASSSDFRFSARLGNGRSRDRGRIRFEAPPQTVEIESWQLLPQFLGSRTDHQFWTGRLEVVWGVLARVAGLTLAKPVGPPYERQTDGAKRGEVVDALPQSSVRVGAVFSKPVAAAVLIPIERGDGVRERDLPPLTPLAVADDRRAAEWKFPTTPRMIGYRLELVDDRGFANAVPIRRNVRMSDDRPPAVAFMPESTRHPDPADYDGKGDPRFYEWGDKMPLAEGSRIMVIFTARSEQGVSRANIRYRVIPRGVPFDAYPTEIQKIQHPRDDSSSDPKVFALLPLKPVPAGAGGGSKFVPQLGLFEQSWQGLDGFKRPKRMEVSVEFYSLPSPDPATVPPGLEAGGRYMFEVDKLQKTLPDGSAAKLEIGDTVELFVEVFDKNPGAGRPPGYTREARRKIVVTEDEARYAIKMRDEQNKRLQDKLGELAQDQANVFKEPKAKEPKQTPKE
jgi:hypothetical protein